MVDLAQRLDGGLSGAVPLLARPAQLHKLRHAKLHGGSDHSCVRLRLEVGHKAVEELMAGGRGRGLGAVDLAQHQDSGRGVLWPIGQNR